MRAILSPALLLALTVPALAEDTVVEVIPVLNRPAADLVAALQPLAGPEGMVSSMENKLIVKATPAALAQIKAVLRDLDVAPRSLWVSVRHSSAARAGARDMGVTITKPASGSSIETGADGITITSSRSRSRVTGAAGTAAAFELGSDVQKLQTLEGRPAFIKTGVAVGYIEAESGFWVVPHVSGGNVTLEIHVAKDAFKGPGIETRRADTSVSGRLGEWLSVGSVSSSSQAQGSGLLSQTVRSSASDWRVELKVEAGIP